MALFDDRNTAAAAGDHYLTGIRQRADGVNLHNINGLRRCHHTAESFAGLLYYIIPLLDFNLGVFRGHIAADHFSRLVEGLVVRIHSHLRQDRADGPGDTAAKQFRAQGVLDVISDIALAHGGADAHRRRGVVDIDPAQFGHGLVDHADLWTVAVGDGKLITGLHQIGQCSGGDLYGVTLF